MPFSNLKDVIDSVCKMMFEAEDRRIQNWIDKLCKDNRRYYNNPHTYEVFLHHGIFYRPSWFPKGLPPTKPLHSELYPEMDMLVAGKRVIDSDQQFIRQLLFKLLYPCDNEQDVRDALPDCLTTGSTNYNRLQRTREPAYTIQGDARAMKQFDKLLSKIELYLAIKLIV